MFRFMNCALLLVVVLSLLNSGDLFAKERKELACGPKLELVQSDLQLIREVLAKKYKTDEEAFEAYLKLIGSIDVHPSLTEVSILFAKAARLAESSKDPRSIWRYLNALAKSPSLSSIISWPVDVDPIILQEVFWQQPIGRKKPWWPDGTSSGSSILGSLLEKARVKPLKSVFTILDDRIRSTSEMFLGALPQPCDEGTIRDKRHDTARFARPVGQADLVIDIGPDLEVALKVCELGYAYFSKIPGRKAREYQKEMDKWYLRIQKYRYHWDHQSKYAPFRGGLTIEELKRAGYPTTLAK